MRKTFTLLFCILHCAFCIGVKAQELKQIQENCQFYVVSANANCFAGARDGGPANFYRFSDDYFCQTEGHYASFITDKGEMAASYDGCAAIWTLGTEDYRTFLAADGENIKGRIMGFSKDFASLLVANKGYFVYEKHDDGLYHATQIFLPERDSIYRLAPQHVQIKGFSSDGRRIAGRFMNSDGQRETPFVIEKSDNGEWETRFVGIRNILHEGCVLPDRPVREGENDPTYNSRLMEYYEIRGAMETGIYYELSNMSMSENGKYLAVNVPMMGEGEAYQMVYAGVVDIDKDTLYIFKSVPDACCPAVSNYGEASICTPALAYLRQTYIGSINDVDNPKLLVDWAKEKTNGKLDLSEQMMFAVNANGDKEVIGGSALISAEGNGFVSFVVDEWDTSDLYNFLVRFDAPTDEPMIQSNRLSLFPNPTSGVLCFEDELFDIKIFDLAGRIVYSQASTATVIDLSLLHRGIYIIEANSAMGIVREKIEIL